jgi:hypothetical protein
VAQSPDVTASSNTFSSVLTMGHGGDGSETPGTGGLWLSR